MNRITSAKTINSVEEFTALESPQEKERQEKIIRATTNHFLFPSKCHLRPLRMTEYTVHHVRSITRFMLISNQQLMTVLFYCKQMTINVHILRQE